MQELSTTQEEIKKKMNIKKFHQKKSMTKKLAITIRKNDK